MRFVGLGWKGGGKTVVLGVEMNGTPLSIDPYEMLRGRTIMGCLLGGIKPKSDISSFAKMYLDHVRLGQLSLTLFVWFLHSLPQCGGHNCVKFVCRNLIWMHLSHMR